MFGSLQSMPLKDFFEQEGAGDNLVIFIHVPKTAGSSFAAELANNRPPYRNIHIAYSETRERVRDKMQAAVADFIAELDQKDFLSCSGHINLKHADAITERRPGSKLITFVRNPVARVISDFRYQRTPAHPPYRDFISKFPTLEAYVEAPESQNKMHRILTGNGRTPVPDAIELLDRRYAFVGVVEMYPMSFNMIFRLFGKNKMPSEYKRKTETTGDNSIELTGALKRKIRELNWKDAAIYDHARNRLAGRREEWASLRRERATV